MSRKRLVLFDIDGTLIHGGPLWRECFEGAVKECFPRVNFRAVTFCGKTDRQICREMMEHAGYSEDAADRILREYLDRARKCLESRAHEIEVLPGVREILPLLKAEDSVSLGLLTGNVREGAALKLTSVGLDNFFTLGAYGDDHWDRYQLPAIAVTRAHLELGLSFQGKEIVIIGDTIHDVQCGRSIGVRSIAVGTGRPVRHQELKDACPDYFLEDLGDPQRVLSAILDDL